MVDFGVNRNQPFLTGFSARLYGRAKASAQARIACEASRISANSIAENASIFAPILSPGLMAGFQAAARNRSFTPTTSFWAWIDQLLDANSSCSKAVSRVQTWCAENNRTVPSSATGAYCLARQRLGSDFLAQIHQNLTQAAGSRRRSCDLWRGFVPKAIDGSSVQLLDTPENQQRFPQSSSQQPGCGFPIMAIAGVLDLSTGAWLGMTTGPAHTHDTRLAAKLLEHFEPGDLVLADRAFNSYEMLVTLQQRGAQSLMRLHASRHRSLDWRKGKKLGSNERLVTWHKPVQIPRGTNLDAAQWAALPASISIRLIRFNYENRAGEKVVMVLATTLTDSLLHPWEELSDLYAMRWDIELKLRDLKTTLKLERFEVRSPDMAEKTLQMVMIAQNLIRAMVQRAACAEGISLTSLSFKGSLDLIRAWQSRFRGRAHHCHKRAEIHDKLLEIIATKRLTPRPFRHEPRAVKRRPKPFAKLTEHRHTYQEIQHRSRYQISTTNALN